MAARLSSSVLAVAAFALIASSDGHEPRIQDSTSDEEELALATDALHRLTIPVMVQGSGPYRFLVDTGAERTTISREVAQDLQLPRSSAARLHSMSEASDVRTVLIEKLSFGTRSVKGIHAPALLLRHMGADGILGIDSLQSQLVLFDFKTGSMALSTAKRRSDPVIEPGTIVVRARRKSGRLVIADARADGAKVEAVIDSGSAISIGNNALRRKLSRRNQIQSGGSVRLISVTGGVVTAEIAMLSHLTIGGVTLKNLPVAFADAHAFKQLQLSDKPALFLGMNALRSFDRVLLDFPRRRAFFQLRDLPRADPWSSFSR